MRHLLFILLLSSGCYSPSIGDCVYACSANSECPNGLSCKDNVCRVDGSHDSCDAVRDGGGDDGDSDAADAYVWTPPRFGKPVMLGGFDTSVDCKSVTVAVDESLLWCTSLANEINRSESFNGTWSMPTLVSELSGGAGTQTVSPAVDAAGTSMYLSYSSGSDFDIYRATRPDLNSTWPHFFQWERVGPFAAGSSDEAPGTTAMNDRVMIFSSTHGSTDHDLYETQRTGSTSGWTMPEKLAEISGPRDEQNPSVTEDGLTVLFDVGTFANGTLGGRKLVMAHRPAISQPFSPPVDLTDLSLDTGGGEYGAWLSPDGNVIYFVRDLVEGRGLFRAEALH